MEFLLICILAGVVAWLWNRQQKLSQRIEELEERSFSAPAPAHSTYRASENPAPKRTIATVRSEPQPETQSFEREPSVGRPLETKAEALPPAEPAESLPETEPEPETRQEPVFAETKPRFDIEEIFGRRLPIWVGGITLAIAGILLVRYSIDAGLVTPSVRVLMAFVFGIGLIAGAEWTYRNPEKVNDGRICQALAGAGLATLYAGFYLAGSQYGLIGQTFAFLGLAAVTAGAIALSFRFGLPCAVLGLVGGFAAPMLVGGEEANLPLLTIYLGLVTAGLTQAGERQGRSWLSVAALAVGLGWGLLLLFSGDFGTAEILALGFYLLVLGAVLPALIGEGSYIRPVRLASALLASLQLALLVDRAGDGVLAWALYLLMGATLAALAWKRSDLRESSAVATVIAVGLVSRWDPPADGVFYAIVAAVAGVFVAVPLAHLWRGNATTIDRAQLAGGAIGLAAAVYIVMGAPADDIIEWTPALVAFAMAAFPAIAAWRDRGSEDHAVWFALFTATAAFIILGAALLLTPGWAAPLVATAIFGAVFAITFKRGDTYSLRLLVGAASVAAIGLLASLDGTVELERLGEGSGGSLHLLDIARWGAVAAAMAALAWRLRGGRAFVLAQIGAALFGYGLLAQALPAQVLVWACALIVAALRFARFPAFPAQATFVAIMIPWALVPAATWIEAGGLALAGEGPLLFRWPASAETLLKLAPLAVALGAMRWPTTLAGYRATESIPGHILRAPLYGAAAIAVMVVHVLYKQLFAVDTQTDFIARALAERTVWEALLIGLAALLIRPLPRIGAQPVLAGGLIAVSLAHLIWFTGGVHNPLFTAQAVGPLPLANLALAATAVGLAGIWLLRPMVPKRLEQALDGLAMIMIVVCTVALLRHVFSGSILTDQPMGQTEDLLRSLLGIVLAIAFLLIGRMTMQQSWRIGSLVLMVVAVAKVFLVDAAALEGLLRIASFMALGFSLLGIGWLYARQLGPNRTDKDAAAS